MNLTHLLPLLGFVLIPGLIALIRYSKLRKGDCSHAWQGSSLAQIINSAVLFALSYNIVFFIQELFLVLGKNWIGLDAVLYHNNHNWKGSHPLEALMQGSGAAAIFILGLVFFVLLPLVGKRSWTWLFFAWMAFNGLMQSLPQLATAKMAPETDTGQAFAYLNFSEFWGWAITGFSYAAMIGLLVFFGRLLLRSSPDNSKQRDQFLFIKNIVFYGMLTGLILLIPFRIMPWQRTMAPVFLVLLTMPLLMAFGWSKKQDAYNNEVNRKIMILPIILLLLLLAFFQFILARGIEFPA
jgi:hypothetical protein